MKPQNNENTEAFMKAYGELVEKHKMDFANYPQWVPDSAGGWKTIMQSVPVDVSEAPVKSNFMAE